MTDKDIAIAFTSAPQAGTLTKKPPHLILLDMGGKTPKKFITTDKPDLGTHGFVQAKGLFSDESENAIISNFADLLSRREEIVEMMFPNDRVFSIRNLVFKAK
jgi:hypothetical protein